MAEPKTAPGAAGAASGSGSAPKLVAVPEGADPVGPLAAESEPEPEPGSPEKGGSSRGWALLLVALLLLAGLGLFAQSRQLAGRAEQVARLEGQVQGLEAQLAAAQTELASYDMTLEVIRVSVGDLFQRLGQLQALVQADPRNPGPAPVPPETP